MTSSRCLCSVLRATIPTTHRLVSWYYYFLPVYLCRVYVTNSSVESNLQSRFNPPPAKIKSSRDSPKRRISHLHLLKQRNIKASRCHLSPNRPPPTATTHHGPSPVIIQPCRPLLKGPNHPYLALERGRDHLCGRRTSVFTHTHTKFCRSTAASLLIRLTCHKSLPLPLALVL